MTRSCSLSISVALLCGALLLTACTPSDTTAQTCQRMGVLHEDIAIFEIAGMSDDPDQRVETVRGFALELEQIQDAASNGQLEFAAATLATMYGTIADTAAANPGAGSVELTNEVAPQLEVDRIHKANQTYLRVCEV